MSAIRAGDDRFHHVDGSHRWLSPDPDRTNDDVWRGLIAEHVAAHRRGDDKPRRAGRARACGDECVPAGGGR